MARWPAVSIALFLVFLLFGPLAGAALADEGAPSDSPTLPGVIALSAANSTTEPFTPSVTTDPLIPDPYFYSGGVRYSFLPDGGDCSSLLNCAVSSTPIQSAIDSAASGLTPDDGTIYVEGGMYAEDIVVNTLNNLTLKGSANGNPSTLNGLVNVLNSSNITLRDFIFGNVVRVSDSSYVTMQGTPTDDTITVTLQGSVQNLSVDGGAGSDAVTLNMDASSATVSVADSGAGSGDSLTVNATNGNDQVRLTTGTVSINGDQTINTSGIESQTINTGAGDDTLTLAGTFGDVDVNGGAGTMTISAESHVVAPGGQVSINSDGTLQVFS